MSDFVYDGTPVPNGKSDATTPVGPTDQRVVAAEWNTAMQALLDLRTAVLAIAPEPGVVTGTSGWLIINDIEPNGSGVVDSKVYQDSSGSNTVLEQCQASTNTLTVIVSSSWPKVQVRDVVAVLPRDSGGGFYRGGVNITVNLAGETISAKVYDPNDISGTGVSCIIGVNAPPNITALSFTGSYPGSQTELKAGDTFQVTGTVDKPCVGVQILDFGAGAPATLSFSSTTSFTVTLGAADRGTSPQALTARLQARNSSGAYGPTHDTSNTVVLNNLHPTLTLGSITYPGSQTALKNSETATVAVTAANLDSVLFTSPNGDLAVTAPTTTTSPKTVTRIAGSYNVGTINFQGVATRAANGAATTTTAIVAIANVAPNISISVPAARLRSGGSDGTSVQGYAVTISSNQQLGAAPSLVAPAGTLTGGGFAGGPSTWTRNLNVNDSDTKGSYSFTTLVAVGLSGLTQNSIGSGAGYVLGGFVQRTLTFAAFSQTTTFNTAVTTYSKLSAGIFTATDQAASRNASQGDHSNIANTYTVNGLGSSPTILFWNDVSAAGSNSGGTAQITAFEELV